MNEETLVSYDAYDAIRGELYALEQAITDVCDIETVHVIQARKKVIQKK